MNSKLNLKTSLPNWKKRCSFPRCTRRRGRRTSCCPKHNWQRYKEKYPLRYAFQKLRARAAERGHAFTLTFEQYEQFAIKTNYATLKGKSSQSLSVDRIDPKRGYHADNIRAITLRENSRRQFTNMPEWMKEELRLAENGQVPDTHKNLLEVP